MVNVFSLGTYSPISLFAQKLAALYLSSNKIGDVGAQHLADALKNNTVILMVCFFDYRISI